jgi:hypothetical protein
LEGKLEIAQALFMERFTIEKIASLTGMPDVQDSKRKACCQIALL